MYESGRWPLKKYVVKQVQIINFLLYNMKSELKKIPLGLCDIIVRIQNRIRTRNLEFWDLLHEILSPSKAMDAPIIDRCLVVL